MSSLKKNSKPSKVARVAKYLKTKVSAAFGFSLSHSLFSWFVFIFFCCHHHRNDLRHVFVCVFLANWFFFISFLGSEPTKTILHSVGSINVNFCTHCKNRLNANRFTFIFNSWRQSDPNRLTAILFLYFSHAYAHTHRNTVL